MFSLLRAHHHLDYARKGARMEAVPRALARVKEYLAGVVCPAAPRPATAVLLEGGAAQWLKTSLQILEGHYVGMIEEVRRDLRRFDGGNHQEAWKVAIKWLTQKYKPVNPEVFREAREVVRGLGWEVGRFPGGRMEPPPPPPPVEIPPVGFPVVGSPGVGSGGAGPPAVEQMEQATPGGSRGATRGGPVRRQGSDASGFQSTQSPPPP